MVLRKKVPTVTLDFPSPLVMWCPYLCRYMGQAQNPYLWDGEPYLRCYELIVYKIQSCVTVYKFDKDYYWLMLVNVLLKLYISAEGMCSIYSIMPWQAVLVRDGKTVS
jgi:hypothetical protein